MNIGKGVYVGIGLGLAVLAAGVIIGQRGCSQSPPGISEEQGDANQNVAAAGSSKLPRLLASTQDQWKKLDNPETDGWLSEAFSEVASNQWKQLGKLIASSKELSPSQVGFLVADDFSCNHLLPQSTETQFSDGLFEVQKGSLDASDQPPSDGIYRGASGFVQAIQELLPQPEQGSERQEFKIVRAEIEGASAVTRQHVAFAGRCKDGFEETHATWVAGWERRAGSQAPRLRWLKAISFERSRCQSGDRPLLIDCTSQFLGENQELRRQLLHGYDHWLGRIQMPSSGIAYPGLAMGDVNGDGLEDTYLCQEGGLPNRLLLQNRDGTLRDFSREGGVDWLQDSRGALLVDFDNDGDKDLAVAMHGILVFAQNDGGGRFQFAYGHPLTAAPVSLAAADYDLDGRVDVYLCGYNTTGQGSAGLQQAGVAILSSDLLFDSNNGGANVLLHNEIVAGGEWHFTDVTTDAGLHVNNRRWSVAAAWEDFDNDGDQDLYVANDFGKNLLFRNDGGRFSEIAKSSGVEDIGFGMSVSWSDYDHDGDMDLYVGNMFSSAGNRVTHQSKFKPAASGDVRGALQRMARGNSLFENRGSEGFEDVTGVASVMLGRWAWSSVFGDLNNDAWDDLLVANGFMTGEFSDDL